MSTRRSELLSRIAKSKEKSFEEKRDCAWIGCANTAEASLSGRAMCRDHFYETGKNLVNSYRESLQKFAPEGTQATVVLTCLSEVISETTSLVARAKFLGPWQLDQFHGLCVSAMELYRRIQRSPRMQRVLPLLLHRASGNDSELTSTVDISKRGACVSTGGKCAVGDQLLIESPPNPQRSLARVAWVKPAGRTRYLIGLEIVDHENFWGLAV